LAPGLLGLLGHFIDKDLFFSSFFFQNFMKRAKNQDKSDFMSWKIYHQIPFHAMDYIIGEKLQWDCTAREILKTKVFFLNCHIYSSIFYFVIFQIKICDLRSNLSYATE